MLDAEPAFAGVPKGAHLRTPEVTKADVMPIAAGSEVVTCLTAAAELKAAGIVAKVVLMPSFRIYDEQPEHKAALPPEGTPRRRLSRRDDGLVQVHRDERRGDRDRLFW